MVLVKMEAEGEMALMELMGDLGARVEEEDRVEQEHLQEMFL